MAIYTARAQKRYITARLKRFVRSNLWREREGREREGDKRRIELRLAEFQNHFARGCQRYLYVFRERARMSRDDKSDWGVEPRWVKVLRGYVRVADGGRWRRAGIEIFKMDNI